MKSLFYYVMVVAIVVAVVAPMAWAQQADLEPDSLLSHLEGGAGNSKPFNLQGATSQRRAHGIYFNGR